MTYHKFVLSEPVLAEGDYDSDVDPSFVPNSAFDIELDYDEYSDGEVPEEEVKELVKVRNNDSEEF